MRLACVEWTLSDILSKQSKFDANTAYYRLCKHLTENSVADGELGLRADAFRMIPSMDQHGHNNRFWRERGGNVKKRPGLLIAVFALRRQLTRATLTRTSHSTR